MAEEKRTDQPVSTLAKVEEMLFPIAAAAIGIGYTVAILVNNPLGKVLASPHALILIAIFAGIAFFPLRSLARHLLQKQAAETAR